MAEERHADAHGASEAGTGSGDGTRTTPDREASPADGSYHRPATPHRTMPPVDDLAEDDLEASINYVHDTDYANGSLNPLESREYRRNRSELSKAQKDLRYGQYLEVPKGRRAIFSRQERNRRIKSALALVALIVVLGIVAYFIWGLIAGAAG
jgi:hypothetical protein